MCSGPILLIFTVAFHQGETSESVSLATDEQLTKHLEY